METTQNKQATPPVAIMLKCTSLRPNLGTNKCFELSGTFKSRATTQQVSL